MDFEKFKKRYHEKLDKMGVTERPDDDELAKLYLGLVIFSEWQADEIEKANRLAASRKIEDRKKIYVPEKGILQ